jgi:hypothetical protein
MVHIFSQPHFDLCIEKQEKLPLLNQEELEQLRWRGYTVLLRAKAEQPLALT